MTTWKKTTSEKYDDMLGCLPPAVMTGLGFLVGEPMTHNSEGYPVYEAFAEVGGKFYVAKECLTVKEFKAVTAAEVMGGAA